MRSLYCRASEPLICNSALEISKNVYVGERERVCVYVWMCRGGYCVQLSKFDQRTHIYMNV